MKLVSFDFIQPSKLMLGLAPQDYVAVDENGAVLGRGRNKEAILATPGATGYYSLHEAASAKATPSFDEKPFGSISEVQAVPGWPLIQPVKVNRPDLVEEPVLNQKTLEDAIKKPPKPGGNPAYVMIDGVFMDEGPRRANKIADEAIKAVKKTKAKKATK